MIGMLGRQRTSQGSTRAVPATSSGQTQNKTVPWGYGNARVLQQAVKHVYSIGEAGLRCGCLALKGFGNVNVKSESPARRWAAGAECRKTRLAAPLAPPTSLPQPHAGNFLFWPFILLDFIN